jgi:hypothetical protein
LTEGHLFGCIHKDHKQQHGNFCEASKHITLKVEVDKPHEGEVFPVLYQVPRHEDVRKYRAMEKYGGVEV